MDACARNKLGWSDIAGMQPPAREPWPCHTYCVTTKNSKDAREIAQDVQVNNVLVHFLK